MFNPFIIFRSENDCILPNCQGVLTGVGSAEILGQVDFLGVALTDVRGYWISMMYQWYQSTCQWYYIHLYQWCQSYQWLGVLWHTHTQNSQYDWQYNKGFANVQVLWESCNRAKRWFSPRGFWESSFSLRLVVQQARCSLHLRISWSLDAIIHHFVTSFGPWLSLEVTINLNLVSTLVDEFPENPRMVTSYPKLCSTLRHLLNLEAFINALPLPALDGGKALFVFVEQAGKKGAFRVLLGQ